MRKITARQREVLEWIVSFVDAHAYPPTVQEIGHHFGWYCTPSSGACSTARDHLLALRRRGWISMAPRVQRVVRVLRRPATRGMFWAVTEGQLGPPIRVG